jgi:hypothetical protein
MVQTEQSGWFDELTHVLEHLRNAECSEMELKWRHHGFHPEYPKPLESIMKCCRWAAGARETGKKGSYSSNYTVVSQNVADAVSNLSQTGASGIEYPVNAHETMYRALDSALCTMIYGVPAAISGLNEQVTNKAYSAIAGGVISNRIDRLQPCFVQEAWAYR